MNKSLSFSWIVLRILFLLDAANPILICFFYLLGLDYAYLININYCIITAVCGIGFIFIRQLNFFTFFMAIFLIIEVAKIFIYDVYISIETSREAIPIFYGLCMPIFVVGYIGGLINRDPILIKKQIYSVFTYYCFINCIVIILYFFMYQIGLINYFGMGSSLNLSMPFLIKSLGHRYFYLIFVIIVVSGKRACLVAAFAQFTPLFLTTYRKKPLLLSLIILVFIFGIGYLYKTTNLFHRWDNMFKLTTQYHLTDYDKLVLASGRLEEIEGFINYVKHHPETLIFGNPTLKKFEVVYTTSNSIISKDYSHFVYITFVFRHGIIFLILYLSYILYHLRKKSIDGNFNPINASVYGILVIGFFGANLIIDPLCYAVFALMFYTNNKVNQKHN